MTASLYVYWCPICEIQTDRGWHIFRRGHPLIPQTDGEHTCERIKVVREADLAAAREREATLREALVNVSDGIEQYTGPVRQVAKLARAALAASPADPISAMNNSIERYRNIDFEDTQP